MYTSLSKLLVLLLFSAFSLASGVDTAQPVVNLGYASYAGALNPMSQNTQFLGLRFAAPPIG